MRIFFQVFQFLVTSVVILSSTLAHSQNLKSNALVISGGISLGVYEAGLNYIIIETLRDEDIVENLNRKFKKEKEDNEINKLPELYAVSGASAGALNAIASALSYCEDRANEPDENTVLNNIFRDMWINVDITGLLPSEYTEYNQLELDRKTMDEKNEYSNVLYDSVFNRSIFKDPIEKLQTKVIGDFKNGCNVDIGIMVTHGTSNNYILDQGKDTNTTEIILREQSYAIPIRMEVDGGKVIFKNHSKNILFTNSIKTPERKFILLPQHNGAIDFDSVVRAGLASSAFPLAFGRVPMEYCSKGGNDPNKRCPDGFSQAQGEFIDGGIFNNVPLGLAIDLINQWQKKIPGEKVVQYGNYIFLDPDNLNSTLPVRPDKTDKNKSANDQPSSILELDIKNQLDSILPAITTLRNADMYDDYHTYLTEQTKISYSPTERSQHLTGNYLSAFGAFFDKLFREYDYAVGVYDGLIFSAKQICNTENVNDSCVSTAFQELYDKFFPQDKTKSNIQLDNHIKIEKDLKALIGKFLKRDSEQYLNTPGWSQLTENCNSEFENKKNVYEYKTEILVVYEAINQSKDNSLETFTDNLKTEYINYLKNPGDSTNFSANLGYMMFRKDYWKRALFKRILARLLYLERKNKGDYNKHIAALYIMIPDDMLAPEEMGGKKYLKDSMPWYLQIIPDQIGLDAIQTGMSLGWSWTPNVVDYTSKLWNVEVSDSLYRAAGNFNGFYELDFTIHPNFEDFQGGSYWSLGYGGRLALPEIGITSFGYSVNINSNFSDKHEFDKDFLVGLELNMGLLSDKLRLSLGYRDVFNDYNGEDWSLRLMFTNIDELFWAFYR